MKYPPFNGFLDETHRRNFRAAGRQHGRGGGFAEICGAQRKGGGVCRRAPLKGHWRCLMHAGPKAARAYRERQLAELQMGRLSPDAFRKAEARREANRLRTAWKRDPWLPGSTIDLAEHESDFRLRIGTDALLNLAPAVLDWLRWRYRRFLIDGQHEDRWQALLSDELPARAAAAGDPPLGTRAFPDMKGDVWQAAPPCASSRRCRPDANGRAPRRLLSLIVKLPVVREDEIENLEWILHDHRQVLAPILARCADVDDRLLVAKGYQLRLQGVPHSECQWFSILSHLGMFD